MSNLATIERPDFVEDEHLEYLDELRESGITNMWGAGPFLDRAFPELGNDGTSRSYRSSEKASGILAYWMKTFGVRHPEND